MHDMPKIQLVRGYRLQWEKAQDAYVLLYPEGMVKLNPTASEILQMVDGERNAQQIIEALEKKYPDAELADDVSGFLEIAKGNGWLVEEAG